MAETNEGNSNKQQSKKNILFATVNGVSLGALVGWVTGDIIRSFSRNPKSELPLIGLALTVLGAGFTGYLGYADAVEKNRESGKDEGCKR
jgi:hypothetical protein